ncbi:MAG: BMP family protein [Muribaculaceae bacterium]|nr:BMP family protein [Muribaculaceae bacterium]
MHNKFLESKIGIRARVIGIIVFVFIIVSSCSSNKGEPDLGADNLPQIIVLYAPGGLGDQGYNDCVLAGVQKFKKENHSNVEIYQYSPGSIEDAAIIVSDWLSLPQSAVPALLVLGSREYENMLADALAAQALTPNKKILFFESDNPRNLPVTTFRLSMYGASYLAGITAAADNMENGGEKDVLALLAHPEDEAIAAAGRGFCDGFNSCKIGSKADVEYLAEDWTGFISAQTAYRRMSEWSHRYSFIFPVAGGSNQGIYRYTREYPAAPLTAGMDVDQSGLSRNITGSLIKHIDRVIYDYMGEWLKRGELPESKVYGLDSGYVDWLVSPHFPEFKPLVESARAEAIKREEAEI